MNPEEEQSQELEVLQSIYPDELSIISQTHFQILMNLDTPSTRNHSITLDVKYPPEYPNVVPQLNITADSEIVSEDEDSDEEARHAKRIINLPEQVEFSKSDIGVLRAKLVEEAEMQVGIPMVFALASVAKEEAEMLFQRKLDTLENHREEELHKQEVESSKKFMGTKVTKESFEKWRLAFRKELGIDDKLAQFYRSQHQGKLSGREIFERGLAGEGVEEELEGLSLNT